MSEPVLGVDLPTAAYRRAMESVLVRDLILSGLIGFDAAFDAPDDEKISTAWVFQGLTSGGVPYRDPEGSGASALVFQSRSDWAGDNAHNTAAFPQLQCLIYADSTRNADGSVLAMDAERRARTVLSSIHRLFHLPQNREEDRAWPGMYVHSCLSAGPVSMEDVPNTQGTVVRLEKRYNTVTDTLIV